jgi:hypothetical protein
LISYIFQENKGLVLIDNNFNYKYINIIWTHSSLFDPRVQTQKLEPKDM